MLPRQRHLIAQRLCRILPTLLLTASGALLPASPALARSVPHPTKLYLDHPGIHQVEPRALAASAGEEPLTLDGLRLERREGGAMESVPYWFDEASGTVRFVAESSWFRPEDLQEARPLEVVVARWAGEGAESGAPLLAREVAVSDGVVAELEPAALRRRVHLEEEVQRVPATLWQRGALDTLWYWAILTQQGSSQLEVELGPLADRLDPSLGPLELRIEVGLLGWSRTAKPAGMAQHRVGVFLNGETVGEVEFDGGEPEGKGPFVVTLEGVSPELLRPDSNRLGVKVLERRIEGARDPFFDIVYLDWIEVSYRVGEMLADRETPLVLGPSVEPRWWAGPAAGSGELLVAAPGWWARPGPAGGWVVPALGEGEGETEVWVMEEGQVRSPVTVVSLTEPASVPAATEYLMLAPPHLLAGAERLAAVHRGLGRSVAVVDVNAVYDELGGGEESPWAIRAFLDRQRERSRQADGSPALRWVLLVGDADWFEPDDGPPALGSAPVPAASEAPDGETVVEAVAEAVDRQQVPSWTYLSRYGPAASDHYYALPVSSHPEDEALPRFALGRLPVATAAELEGYVDKVIAWIEASRGGAGSGGPGSMGVGSMGAASVLMLSDASRGSRLQQRRMKERLADAPVAVLGVGIEADGAGEEGPSPREAALAALAREPFAVYFGGHGSRFVWQLGDPKDPDPETFFHREDVAQLAPVVRQPIVFSISCATAPFDHPNADSLGEVMVLGGERGAVAFVGSSAALETPPVFGEALVRGLLKEKTLGEAVLAAKAKAGRTRVSYLYGLLGDPGLPLPAAHAPEGGTGQ